MFSAVDDHETPQNNKKEVKRKRRSTKAVFNQRVAAIYPLILSGASRREIIKIITKRHQDWNVSDAQLDKYMKAAREEIQRVGEPKRKEELRKAHLRLENLFYATMQTGDYPAALRVQAEINKLYGLYAPEKIELDTKEPLILIPTREPVPVEDEAPVDVREESA